MSEPSLHAHRGASHAAPENTLAAFALASDEGADAIELDVRLTADHQPIVFHDDDLARMTGVSARVADTAWSTIAELAVGGEPIPRLADLVAFSEVRRVPLNVELKPSARPGELVAACAPILRSLAALVPTLVSSFDPRALALIHQHLPALRLALIFDDPRGLTALAYLPPVDLHPHHGLIDEPLVVRLLTPSPARKLRAWTVDDPAEAVRLLALRHPREPERPALDALITNRPGPLRAELAERVGPPARISA
jgi:glycerophosphoryl diester phosphodiesterase